MKEPITSNPKYDRAREVLVKHYFPIINEAIALEGNELRPLNPDDFIIISKPEMEKVAQQDFGKIHPELSDILEEACRQKDIRAQIEMLNDSINGITVGFDRKIIALNGGMEYIGQLNQGGDWRVGAPFIPLISHEVGHYSVTGQQYASSSPLVETIKKIRVPVFKVPDGVFSSGEYEKLLENLGEAIRNMQGVSIEVESARILIKGLGKDGVEYKIGSLGYNFTETLTDWFTERIRKRAIDGFVNRNRDLSARLIREGLTKFPTKSEISGLRTYSVNSAKSELGALGLNDIAAMRRVFLSSEIPQLYFEKHPTANVYLS